MLRFLYINAAFIAGVIMLNFVFDHNYISLRFWPLAPSAPHPAGRIR